MRLAPLLTAVCLLGCRSRPPVTNPVEQIAVKLPAHISERESTKTVRRINRNVDLWQELLAQGKTTQAHGLQQSISRDVDENYDAIAQVAREGEFTQLRNLAVKCLGFARKRRDEARDLLDALLDDPQLTLVQNAALALGILAHPKTDLTKLIGLLAHGDAEVRANAATSLAKLFRTRETPRDLTPEYVIAADRLAALLADGKHVRGRRAAAFAFANMHHPDMLPHLLAAIQDDDAQVQIGGLYGVKELEDERALEDLYRYLDRGPGEAGASWAKEALVRIAIRTGLAKEPGELEKLGTSARAWREWFEKARR
jgi:HEAT repeat protein